MSTISDLVKQRQADLAAQEKREAQELKAYLDAATKAVEAAMGELHQEIGPYSEPSDTFGSQRSRPHLPTTISWAIKHPEYGRFYVGAGIKLSAEIDLNEEERPVVDSLFVQPQPLMNGHSGRVDIADKTKLADFFIERVEAVKKAQAEARGQRMAELSTLFWNHQGLYTPEQAEAMVQELIVLEPSAETVFLVKFDAWKAQYAKWQAEELRRAEAELVKGMAEGFYVWALAWWDKERGRVLGINRQIMADLQLQFDKGVFQLWEMEYAVSGRDEEGAVIAETRTALVLSGKPDSEDEWLVWDADAQAICPTRFFTAVALKRWGFVKPSESPCYLDIRPKGMLTARIRVNPAMWDRQAEVQAFVDEKILPLTPLPDPVLFGLSAESGRNVRDGFFGR